MESQSVSCGLTSLADRALDLEGDSGRWTISIRQMLAPRVQAAPEEPPLYTDGEDGTPGDGTAARCHAGATGRADAG
jgi:hypothetical protein